jgi:hypothetical protein
MPVTVTEKFESRAGSDDEIELVFVVEGTDDDGAARAALAAQAPGTYGTLVRQTPTIEPVGPNLWEGKAKYIKPEFSQPQTGDSSFSFDTTGGSQHITQSRQTIQKYAPSGQTAPDFGGAIGVTHDNVEGVDIQVPVFSFSVTKYIPNAQMTGAYIGHLYANTGRVNDASFTVNVDGVTLTFAAGECLFLGATGGKRGDDDWELTFRFAGSPNATNLTVGTITGINKKGWEYMWVRYADTEDAAAKAVVKKPIAVYIEKVYENGSFGNLSV